MTAEEYLNLLDNYNNTDKNIIIANIKKYAVMNNIKYPNKWLCDILGLSIDMIRRYMTLTKIHQKQKFQLEQLCKISIALNIPIENILNK